MPLRDDGHSAGERIETPPPGPGAVVAGRYALGALLGSGGMGRVYAARDRKLEREVAVKLLSSPSPEREVLRRFEREALAAGSLQHPNVVAVFDAGEENGRPFLITELLNGQTLRAKLATGPLPVAEALRIARQIAAGLAAAHEKGLIHRDLKPENVFVTSDGWVKILDFGLVKLAEGMRNTRPDPEPPPDESSTGAGRMLGTVGYMAPEQVRGRPVDARTDLFNFGLVLYEMLSGVRPFRGASPTETGYATLFREPDPLPRSVGPKARQLVAQCLEKDPAKRIGSARELLSALDVPGLDAAPRPPFPRVSGRVFLAAAAVLALCAALFAAHRARRGLPATAAGPPPSGTIAILPFSARDAPQFAWLAEGVIDLLARDLEGSDLRVVDSASVLRALGGDASADIDKVRGASAQLGAKYFVLGRVEDRGGQLVLEAVLHTGDAGLPEASAAVQGDPPQLLRLVRKLSDQLQRRSPAPAEFESRLTKLARRTSRSPEALRAWLEGEQLMRRGHWDEVVSLFQKAVAADPQFALAQYRLGLVAEQTEPGLAEDALVRAHLLSDRLSPSERVLLPGRIALQRGSFADAESAFQEATRKFPDDQQTWMELAELYFHKNPLRARSPQESADALQHVLVLDPLNTEAMGHLTELALLRGERALAGKLADRLIALVDERGQMLNLRLTLAWARGDGAEEDKVLDDLFKPGTWHNALANFAFVRLEWLQEFEKADRVAARVGASETPEDRASEAYLHGVVQLARGRPEAARPWLQLAARLEPSGSAPYRAVWADALDFFHRSPAQLAAARAAAETIDVSHAAYLLPRKQSLIGVLAVRAGDAAAAEKAAAVLDRMPPPEGSSITSDLALAIRARLLAARHDAAGALALLEKQQLRVPMRWALFYDHLSDSQLRAELLGQLGRTREALQTWDALDLYRGVDPVFLPAAHLAKARLLDKAGDRDGAIVQYAAFVGWWQNCEQAERPEVDLAEARLAALRHEGERASR